MLQFSSPPLSLSLSLSPWVLESSFPRVKISIESICKKGEKYTIEFVGEGRWGNDSNA